MKILALSFSTILLTSVLACQSAPTGQTSQHPEDHKQLESEAISDEQPTQEELRQPWWQPYVVVVEPPVEEEKEQMDAATLASLIDDPEMIALGEELYATRCAACHGMAGEGGLAPPLIGGEWEYGSEPIDIYQATWDGIPASGMPGHSHMEPDEVAATVAYMLHEFDPNYP